MIPFLEILSQGKETNTLFSNGYSEFLYVPRHTKARAGAVRRNLGILTLKTY